jgi:23S rRNA (uracil1939-C5)-methyltransferase
MSRATIITEKMVFGGDCIAKIDGKTVFVPYAVPGETLDVEIEKDFRDYSVAKILSVEKPSPHRTVPVCPLYGICGGCSMQHIDSAYQEKLRADILRDAFLREGVNVPEIKVISASPFGYRCRFQFHDGGLMKRGSNEVIDVDHCPIATDEINRWLSSTSREKRPSGRVHVFGSDRIVSLSNDGVVVARERERNSGMEMPVRGKGKKQKKIKPRFEGTSASEENKCTVNLLGHEITFDVQGFFQSNLDVLEKAIPVATGGLSGGNALDLYSGCGTFAVFLSDRFSNVTLVEHNRDALVYAETNLQGKKHESYGLSGETWASYHAEGILKRNGPFDAAVVDPPRSGIEKAACKWLSSSGIPHIRSVSCDTATHARDAKFLTRAGYRLSELYLLDFYPQTCHIESLALFDRQEPL